MNGATHHEPKPNDGDAETIQELQQKLAQANEEKEKLAGQYQTLLDRLQTMRNTLGNKLKQDAEELDRREQLVQQLTAQNDELETTVETLKAELLASHEEIERSAKERDALASTRDLSESIVRERELREAQGELERCRIERDEWERKAVQERMVADEVRASAEILRRELEAEKDARDRDASKLTLEVEKTANLQSVLEDFQAAKDHELRQAVKDYEIQLNSITQSLAEYKSRALSAELQLEESQSSSLRAQELEKEVKEKNLLIGKLRHEAVIINEHLMEALRRLRRNSSDTNVDRRLVTNVLLQFLTIDRADPKKFEMLSLLSSILSWSDSEREKAGLQRTNSAAKSSSFWSRSASLSPRSAAHAELDKTDETESFSRLWVEFLLTEADGGSTPPTPARTNSSLPPTPTSISPSVSLSGGNLSGLRQPSFSSLLSSPKLTVSPPPQQQQQPSRKGKEKAVENGA